MHDFHKLVEFFYCLSDTKISIFSDYTTEFYLFMKHFNVSKSAGDEFRETFFNLTNTYICEMSCPSSLEHIDISLYANNVFRSVLRTPETYRTLLSVFYDAIKSLEKKNECNLIKK